MRNVVFFGSSFFSKIVLELLAVQAVNHSFEISGIVTKPDTLYGRNRQKIQNAVKSVGIKNGIRVKSDEQSTKVFLNEVKPDICLVAAYGVILRESILEMPKFGFLNIHGSYLPALRGAIPIQMAIFEGNNETGVSLMKMNAGMDTGDVLMRERLPIADIDTFYTLGERMAIQGVNLFLDALEPYCNGTFVATPQEDEGISYCYVKDLDMLRCAPVTDSAYIIERAARALAPFESLQTTIATKVIQLIDIRVVKFDDVEHGDDSHKLCIVKENGKKRLLFRCSDAYLDLIAVKPIGKTTMSGEAFYNGYVHQKQQNSKLM